MCFMVHHMHTLQTLCWENVGLAHASDMYVRPRPRPMYCTCHALNCPLTVSHRPRPLLDFPKVSYP